MVDEDRFEQIKERLASVLHSASQWAYRDDIIWLLEEVERLRAQSSAEGRSNG